jgi:hypothetical protein
LIWSMGYPSWFGTPHADRLQHLHPRLPTSVCLRWNPPRVTRVSRENFAKWQAESKRFLLRRQTAWDCRESLGGETQEGSGEIREGYWE